MPCANRFRTINKLFLSSQGEEVGRLTYLHKYSYINSSLTQEVYYVTRYLFRYVSVLDDETLCSAELL